MSNDLEPRVRKLEEALETFFDALGATATPLAADAARSAGSGPTPAVPRPAGRDVEARLSRVERQLLRVQLEVGALGATGEPWDPEMDERLLNRRGADRGDAEEAQRLMRWISDKIDTLPDDEADAASKRLETALLEMDAPRARAERLATLLLLERDGDLLRRRGIRAGCWDGDGWLIGAGETRREALDAAVERCGAEQAETWLVAEVPRGGAGTPLALRLLLERDAEALRRRGARAACWDADGVLIGVGETREAAEQDAARRFRARGVLSRLSAEVPPADAEAEVLDPALRRWSERDVAAALAEAEELAAAIYRRLEARQEGAVLTAAEVLGIVDAAVAELSEKRDLRDAGGD